MRVRDVGRSLAGFIQRASVPTLAIVLGFGLVVGGKEAFRRVVESPRFVLQKVEIRGAEGLEAEEVLAACGLSVGRTRVLRLDESDTALRCQGDLRIRWARVETRLPHTVVISLRLQEPALLAATPQGLVWVDRQGEAFRPWDPLEGPGDLPMLVPGGATDGPFSGEILAQALTLVGLYGRINGAADLRRIEWDPVLGARLYLGERGVIVHAGFGPYRQKMARLERTMTLARSMNLPLGEVRVDGVARPRRVVLRPSFEGALVQREEIGDRVPRGMP